MKKLLLSLAFLAVFILGACQDNDQSLDEEIEPVQEEAEPIEELAEETDVEDEEIERSTAYGKTPGNHNPLISHKFGADPSALVHDGRVYIYATYDEFEYDGEMNVTENTYANINQLSVISSADLVNWTDHGVIDVAGPSGAATWATQSWAPTAVKREIEGEEKFFIYFANNASNIGVVSSDSPLGPFEDPIDEPIVSWSTPGVDGVTWLFDPAVIVDDDDRAYLYFGGGIVEGEEDMPNTARVIELGHDMTSVIGEAEMIPAPFMFESAGINKYNEQYYYTYSTNFYQGERPEGSPGAGEIAYMTSENPMGPWEYQSSILKNPGHFFDVGGNNHQDIFEFEGNWYIAYHAQTVAKDMDQVKGYRSTHINNLYFDEAGYMVEVEADLAGVEQLANFNPYEQVAAETLAWSAGIEVVPLEDEGMMVTEINAGDWIGLSSVDFEEGATSFHAQVEGIAGGTIEIRLGSLTGDLIGELTISPGEANGWQAVSTEIEGASNVDDLYFIFMGEANQSLFNLDYWYFES